LVSRFSRSPSFASAVCIFGGGWAVGSPCDDEYELVEALPRLFATVAIVSEVDVMR
jgi:hypothetical protein